MTVRVWIRATLSLMRSSAVQLRSSEEKERWLKMLQDGAAAQGPQDHTQEKTSKGLR